jgi:hypothetical protein
MRQTRRALVAFTEAEGVVKFDPCAVFVKPIFGHSFDKLAG